MVILDDKIFLNIFTYLPIHKTHISMSKVNKKCYKIGKFYYEEIVSSYPERYWAESPRYIIELMRLMCKCLEEKLIVNNIQYN